MIRRLRIRFGCWILPRDLTAAGAHEPGTKPKSIRVVIEADASKLKAALDEIELDLRRRKGGLA